jgi:ABC-type antimicrobial peptide transport system permease subunit
MKNKSGTDTPASRLTAKRIVLILGSLAIVCAAVVAIIVLNNPQQPAPAVGVSVINENNYKEIDENIQDKVAKGMFRTYMSNIWHFPDGSSASSDAVMGNSKANTYAIWFEVVLKETQEVVFTSGLLPVGTQIDEIKLTQNLNKGEYPASVKVHMVDENNEPLESNTSFAITLVVKN